MITRTTCMIILACLQAGFVMSQPGVAASQRSRLTIMVIPSGKQGQIEQLASRIENERGYKEAIAEIESALLAKGYANVVDFATFYETIRERLIMAAKTGLVRDMESYIENAPADIFIQTEIVWDESPGQIKDRQVRLRLKAVDTYNAAVYSNNAYVKSRKGEFSDLTQAVQNALTVDGGDAFNAFLKQLDTSYNKVIRDGRQMFIKFKIADTCKFLLTDWVDGDRLSDKIAQCMGRYSNQDTPTLIGEGERFCDYRLRVPAVDEKGNAMTPVTYIRYKIDQYFRSLGFEFVYHVKGPWINFTLLKRSKTNTPKD